LGLGHLTRSLATCQELVEHFEVDFIQGGPDAKKTLSHKRFHHTFLDPLLMRESDSSLYDPSGKYSPEELMERRRQQIFDLVDQNVYEAVITELFPFGRKKFKKEVLGMIDRVKQKNPRAKVYCGLRDILVQKHDGAARDLQMANIVNEYYDGVFVHSDPRILKLEETFQQVPVIADKIHYTGFIAEAKPLDARNYERKPEILVSMGGGIVGAEMLLAIAQTAALLPEFRFRFFLGPYAPADLRVQLEDIKTSNSEANISVEGFSNNFETELAQSALSISLAGYNTLMNTLNTKTMALMYPYLANEEQTLRGKRFEPTGTVKMIYPEDLKPKILAPLIRTHAYGFPEKVDIDIEGAKNTALLLKQWMGVPQ
jgi:predicted glycosyltransferase